MLLVAGHRLQHVQMGKLELIFRRYRRANRNMSAYVANQGEVLAGLSVYCPSLETEA